jgi:hypothetical protein
MTVSLAAPSNASGENLKPTRRVVVAALGVTQILAWGSTYYLPAVLAKPIAVILDSPSHLS